MKPGKSIYRMMIPMIIGLIFTSLSSVAQVPDEIPLSLKTGNSKTLAKYFNTNVELVVLDNENIYSKSQAEQIIRNFFSSNKPSGFKMIHKGGKESSMYIIGNLTAGGKTFRVYALLKKMGGKSYIHQLRIEKQGS
ncbi:DUF4783 domain-containing protein [Puteibacter caeruleilacunae]|nr:DUF4783 domain-containing protein [Puteibacter caeruleilacunae]